MKLLPKKQLKKQQATYEEQEYRKSLKIRDHVSSQVKKLNLLRLKEKEMLEKMLGVEYESCCYGIKFVIRDYWNGTKTDNAFYFEFLPKGIATSTNKTSELLRQGILGYQDKFDY